MLIEDQIELKRYRHLQGKGEEYQKDAMRRIRAASDARDECQADKPVVILGLNVLIVYGMDEAIDWEKSFAEMGAGVTFVRATRDGRELESIGNEVSEIVLVDILEGAGTPILDLQRPHEMWFAIVAYSLPVLRAYVWGREDLKVIKDGKHPHALIGTFEKLKDIVYFDWRL